MAKKKAAKKATAKKGARKVAKKATKKATKKAAKKVTKKAGAKKAAKKGAKKAAKKGAKKGAKKAAKKGAKKGSKKAAKKSSTKAGAKKKAGKRATATKKATATKPARKGTARKKRTGSSSAAAGGAGAGDAPSGLLRPTADSQPAAVGGTSQAASVAKKVTPSGPAPASGPPPRPRATGGTGGRPRSAATASPTGEASAGRRGDSSRRSPMGRKPVEVLYEGPPPVPTPEVPEKPVRRASAVSPKESVLTVNEAFYRAVEDRDIGSIARIWANDDSVRCTQPNAVLLRGWEEVRRGFEQLFSADRPHRIELTQVYAEESDALAFVSLVEQVAMPQSSRPRREHVATNLFRNIGGQWRMIYHHVT